MATIRAEQDELAMIVEIAVRTAPGYAVRNLFTPSHALDRDNAIEALTQRITAAIAGRYELVREAREHECAPPGAMPLFPELDRHGATSSAP